MSSRIRAALIPGDGNDPGIVDACAIKPVINPWPFDVLVTTKLCGDIRSDGVAGMQAGGRALVGRPQG